MIKDHKDSPVKTSELRLDFTNRPFVVRDGTAYRVTSKQVRSGRTWVRWMKLAHVIGPAASIPT